MPTVTRKIAKCAVCGHEWKPRGTEKPLRCANCGSPYWDRPRKVKE